MCRSPVSIHIVVERQLFVLLNVPFREDAHPDILAHSPLGYVAVWATTVVGETTNATILRSIDELQRWVVLEWVLLTVLRREISAHLVLLQHHEVKVPYTLRCIVPHAFLERNIANHVANVLVDESVPIVFRMSQTSASAAESCCCAPWDVLLCT